jgi:hypothetical protein
MGRQRRAFRTTPTARSGGGAWLSAVTVGVMAVVLVFVLKGRQHVADGAGAFFVGESGVAPTLEGTSQGSGSAVSSVSVGARQAVDQNALAVQTACWRASRALTVARAAVSSPTD